MDICNNLRCIIKWCNDNQGFANLLLSALTLLTSIIAIWVSVRSARLPYKKKLLLTAGSCIFPEGLGLHITVTNVGNRGVSITEIGFLMNKHIYINPRTISDCQRLLNPTEVTSQYYSVDDFKQAITEKNLKPDYMVKACVKDSEGKIYKKKLAKVGDILKYHS